jgi:osmotically-inducible protein OsmY
MPELLFPPDESLRAAVLAVLQADPDLAPLDLRVGVIHAIVHLAGEAPSRRLWQQAGDLAAQVAGVRGVANRIAAPNAPAPARRIQLEFPPNAPPRGDEG